MDEVLPGHVTEQELEILFQEAIDKAGLVEKDALELDSMAHPFNSAKAIRAAAKPSAQQPSAGISRKESGEPNTPGRRDEISRRLESFEQGYSSIKATSLIQRQNKKARKESQVEARGLELRKEEVVRFLVAQQKKLDEWKGFIQSNVRFGILLVLSDFSRSKVETSKHLGLDELHEYTRQVRSMTSFLLDNLKSQGRKEPENSHGQLRDESPGGHIE